MSVAGNDISTDGVKVLYEEVINKLVAVSEVEAPQNSLPYFNPYLNLVKRSLKHTPKRLVDEEGWRRICRRDLGI